MTILPQPQGGTGQNTYTDGQLLIGNSATNGLTKATLTAGTNIQVVTGHGSITINASGPAATLPDPVTVPHGGTGLTSGNSGGVPYYASSTTMGSSLALASNGLVVGSGVGGPPFTPTDAGEPVWQINSGVLMATQNANTVAPVQVQNPLVQLIQNDGLFCEIQFNSFANANVVLFQRADGTGVAPSALQQGDIIGALLAQGYGTSGYGSNSTGAWEMIAGQNWTSHAQGTYSSIFSTPNGSTATQAVLTASADTGVQIKGSPAGDNAPAGFFGEEGSLIVPIASGASLTSGSTLPIAGQSLGAGDWEVSGEVWFNGSAITATVAIGALSALSTSLPTSPTDVGARSSAAWSGVPANLVLPLAPIRQSNPTPATIFLVANAAFTAGSISAFGKIHWRRAR